jgi:large subunit ribosomal protein L25
LRTEGKIPVSVYGGGEDSAAVVANLKDLAAILRTDAGVNTVFSLDIAGVGAHDVIFQDRQIDAVKGRLLHADLRRLTKGEKLEMTVPIHIVGDAPGLEEDGAVINQPLHEIKILVDPANVPDAIEVDVSNLKAGESIHVSDVKFAKGIVREEELEPQTEAAGEPGVVGEETAEGDSEGE